MQLNMKGPLEQFLDFHLEILNHALLFVAI